MVLLVIQWSASKLLKRHQKLISENNALKFSTLLSLLVLVLVSEYNTFHRFTIYNLIFSIPLFLFVMSNLGSREKKVLRLLIAFVSIVLLFLASSRGDLSSLKFFVL